jgi:hypothetical protein
VTCAPFPADQVEELKKAFAGLTWASEGPHAYILLPQLQLGAHCTPRVTDALLCPTSREGYATRMFYANVIEGAPVTNWSKHHILGRDWHAFSWQGVAASLRLMQMVLAHARPLL